MPQRVFCIIGSCLPFSAIAELIREGKSVTYDMKDDRNDPTAVGTSGVADALIEKLQVSK